MKEKLKLFVEYLWLFIAGFSLFGAIREWYFSHWKQSLLFLIMIVVSVLMYFFRRNLRKKLNNTEQN